MQIPNYPRCPYKELYGETTEKEYIYFHKEKLESYYGDEDDYDEDEDDEEDLTPEQGKPLSKDPDQTTFAWLLSQIPNGVKPEDIKIDFGSYASRERIESHHVGFYYEVAVPSRMEQYEIDKAKYDADLVQYNKDVAAYKEWQRQEAIRQTEERLKLLKRRD